MFRDILALQRKKKLFDASKDPRPYSEEEVQEMGAQLSKIWANGIIEPLNRHGVNYQGTFYYKVCEHYVKKGSYYRVKNSDYTFL